MKGKMSKAKLNLYTERMIFYLCSILIFPKKKPQYIIMQNKEGLKNFIMTSNYK